MAVLDYYIFDIKQGEDDVHGDIIIVRAGRVHNNMVSELPSDWDTFFLKDIPEITNALVSHARNNGGRWTVNTTDFRESLVDLEGEKTKVYFHKSLPKKQKGFWSRIFG